MSILSPWADGVRYPFRNQGLCYGVSLFDADRVFLLDADYQTRIRRAIHHILRHVAELAKAHKRLPTPAEIEKIFADGFYLPFANKAGFEMLLGSARKLVEKHLADYSADLLRVWETERHFELPLEKCIVSGRADVILDREGGKINSLALVDYKTSNDPKADDIFGFQLAIYASAGRGEGLKVDAAYLHHLKEGERRRMPVDTPPPPSPDAC